MTTKERMTRICAHKEADRVPIIDIPWDGTLARWRREGMPSDVDWQDYFGVDKWTRIEVDISPRYGGKVLEETDDYIIYINPYGVTQRCFKELDSTPEHLDYRVNTPEEWEKAKKAMAFDENRIPWDDLKRQYPKWVAEGQWLEAGFWFGFDVTHAHMVGTETLLIALLEEPEWVTDMIDTYLSGCIRCFERMWDEGYRFDAIHWYDDMGYKGTPFFSVDTYKELIKPFHKKAANWAHNRGIPAHLHSCGYIEPLIPDVIDAGIDILNPLEVKAGMNPLKLKREYGDKLTLHGGINAMLLSDEKAAVAEIERIVPALKENGGYIFATDHSIPNSVSLKTFEAIVNAAKRCGGY
ncbi:MAG: hypothetical protein FWE86_01255 [Oscillospiraceae bacterium]|nr:hypothetical protein [Oscillospiraceae bacterium]